MIIFITKKKLEKLIDERINSNSTYDLQQRIDTAPNKKGVGKRSAKKAVAELMADGKQRSWKDVHRDIRKAGTRTSEHNVQNALSILCRKGELERVKRGVYKLSTSGYTSVKEWGRAERVSRDAYNMAIQA